MAVNQSVERIEQASAKARFLSKLTTHHGKNARDVGEVILGNLRDVSFHEHDVGGVKLFKAFGFSTVGSHRVVVTTFKPTQRSLVNPDIPITISFGDNAPSVFIVKKGASSFAYGATDSADFNEHSGVRKLVEDLQSNGLRNVNELNELAQERGKHYATVTSGSKRGLVNMLKEIIIEAGHEELHPVIDTLTRNMTVTELHDSRDVTKLIGSFGNKPHELSSVIFHKGKGNPRFKPLLSVSQHVGDYDTHNSVVSGGVHVLKDLESGELVFTHFEDDDYLKNNPGVARAVELLKAHGIEER